MIFREKKTTQAAARFLNLAHNRMNYMKLIKLLYLMDRTALIRWGRPVTGDKYYSMKLGPVLSEVRNLITEPTEPGQEEFWAKHISEPSQWEVTLLKDAGSDELSKAEEELIDEIFRDFGGYAPFDLVKHLHTILPEWKVVTKGRSPIRYLDILRTTQMSPEDIAAIRHEIDEVDRVHRLFSPR
jgi:uncharacterized phage-associated protein